MGKILSVFFAFLAISFNEASAQSCSDRKTCRGCSKTKGRSGCAWHVGPTFEGCIDADKCGTSDYRVGKCFHGMRGCFNSCSVATSCGDCLSHSIFGNRRFGRRSDCAWFVRDGGDGDDGDEPLCVYHKRCGVGKFDGGTCHRGRKRGNASKMCGVAHRPMPKPTPTPKPNSKRCSDRFDCQTCFGEDGSDSDCAWAIFNDGRSKGCFEAEQCDERFLANWTCTKGSDTCPEQDAPNDNNESAEPAYLRPGIWPQLLGETETRARLFFAETYGAKSAPKLQVLKPGEPFTKDIRTDRVRLFVDESKLPVIIKVPRIG